MCSVSRPLLRDQELTMGDMHWWDWTTPIEEVMQGLNNLVKAGKGALCRDWWTENDANFLSFIPWCFGHSSMGDYQGQPVCSRPRSCSIRKAAHPVCNTTEYQVLYQGRWSVKDRDIERELLPMCISEGMGIAPWGAIGQGSFQRKADQGKSKDGRSAKELSEDEKKVSAALEKVADQLKIESVTAVALAWCMSKYPYVYPIIGGRKIEWVIRTVFLSEADV
jgi:aryl-alcohol dehydrogenase-like predicted oxidoreductase